MTPKPKTSTKPARTKSKPRPELEATVEISTTAATADETRRTITGTILTYGELGSPSTGSTIFTTGSVTAPGELDRVKLLVQHDSYAAAVGYMTALDIEGDTLTGTFYLPESDEADQVLADAKAGLRDGLSVGVTISEYDWGDTGEIMHVHAAQLREVSVVTIPAYQSARITNVIAARHETNTIKETNMTDENPTPKAPTIDYGELAAALKAQAPELITPPARTSHPLGLTTASTLSEVTAAAANAHRRGMPVHEVAAALTDVIPSDDAGKGFIRPQWIGEVWQASRTERPFFDGAAQKKTVEGLKVEGWKFDLDNRPAPKEYAGNKAAIPAGGKIKTVPVTGDVVRRAGGWDVDRAFYDLGSPNMLDSLFTAATEEYKTETEQYALTGLLGEATEVEAGTTFAGTLARLGAAAVGVGASLSRIAMSTDLWLEFAELNQDSVPWWLRSQGELNLGTTSGTAGKLQFTASPDLEPGTILAADSRAYTTYELPELIRVEAVNIGNGGIDLGVFGYISLIVNDPRAILKISPTEPAA